MNVIVVQRFPDTVLSQQSIVTASQQVKVFQSCSTPLRSKTTRATYENAPDSTMTPDDHMTIPMSGGFANSF